MTFAVFLALAAAPTEPPRAAPGALGVANLSGALGWEPALGEGWVSWVGGELGAGESASFTFTTAPRSAKCRYPRSRKR